MCGFVGGVLTRPVETPDIEAIRSAAQSLDHRGPDDRGLAVLENANAVLAFRRLSILDLAGGAQPMSTGEGQHIVFNGEIYNYRDLRARLIQDGVPLRTKSDTEALLWTMARKGRSALADLAGMFAFALVDERERCLWLARDRLGVKQVYYAHTPAGFFFASEPKAIVSLPWVRPALAEDQLAAYFTFRAVPAPATLFRGIHKLGPGQVLRLDLDSQESTVESYWHMPDTVTRGQPLGPALREFEQAFLSAVERRLIADVPVGAFLSGGLDSSLVVAAMRRLGHENIATFSATFPGSPDDEATFARRVSQRFGTLHYEHEASPWEFLASLQGWVALNDDLVADASCLPLLAVSRLARDSGYIVLLSGEGADELFGGYGSYHKFFALNRLGGMLPAESLRRTVLRSIQALGILSAQDQPRAFEYLVKRGGFMGTAALLGPQDLQSYLTGSPESTAMPRASSNNLVDLLAFDFTTRIPEDLMVRTDRATMGASIEARVPFLDPQVVNAAFNLSPWQRAVPGVSKVILRLLAHRWGVPRETILHRKIGFQIPIGSWFRRELAPVWKDILNEEAVPGLRYDQVRRVYEAHAEGRGRYEELLWRIAALEFWYRRWVLNSSALAGARLSGVAGSGTVRGLA